MPDTVTINCHRNNSLFCASLKTTQHWQGKENVWKRFLVKAQISITPALTAVHQLTMSPFTPDTKCYYSEEYFRPLSLILHPDESDAQKMVRAAQFVLELSWHFV